MKIRIWTKSLLILASGALLAPIAQAQLAEFNALNAAARAARQNGDHATYLTNVRKLAALSPGHPAVQVALARALALNGDEAGATAQLNRVADFGLSIPAMDDPAFQTLKNDPTFRAVAQRLAANGKGSGRAKGVVKLGLTGGSEGIAWSELSKSFLVGSTGSIHAYRLGEEVPARQVARALGPQVLGIRPDPASRTYLACTNVPEGDGAVVRHRENGGAIVGVYRLPAKNAQCNDIALLKNGAFAVTDSANSIVFHLIGDKLQPLLLTTPVYLPNGIAADLKRSRLYIAHAAGVIVHDLSSGKSRELAAPNALIGAIDGMVWHEGALIGVQNQGAANRLLRITPDAEARFAKVEVLLSGADFPGDATTVAVAQNEAFVIGGVEANGGREEPVLVRAQL